MELNPPDVNVASTLYSAMAGTDADQQLPWSVLCRLLSAKGFAADTVAVVREGLAGGLEMDTDVAEAYIKALCATQQSVRGPSMTFGTLLLAWIAFGTCSMHRAASMHTHLALSIIVCSSSS